MSEAVKVREDRFHDQETGCERENHYYQGVLKKRPVILMSREAGQDVDGLKRPQRQDSPENEMHEQ